MPARQTTIKLAGGSWTVDEILDLSFTQKHADLMVAAAAHLVAHHPSEAIRLINRLLLNVAACVAGVTNVGPRPSDWRRVGPDGLPEKRPVGMDQQLTWLAATQVLRGLSPFIAKTHDAETLDILRLVATHPIGGIAGSATCRLIEVDATVPCAVAARWRGEIEEHYAKPTAPIYELGHICPTVRTRRQKRVIASIAREWERACEALACGLYPQVLTARGSKTTLSNGLRPDFIVDDGSIRRDDHGGVCFGATMIDAKSGAIGNDTYDGYCSELQYWCLSRYVTLSRRRSRGTEIAVLRPKELVALARKHKLPEAAREIERLAGPDGDATWRLLGELGQVEP